MPAPIDRLTFIYDADGTLLGEAKYWFGTLFGGDHCSLCDLTHSRLGKRRDFKECASRLDLPIEYFHRDDVPADARAAAPRLPAVVGHTGGEARRLLGPEELGPLHGDLPAFEAALQAAVRAAQEA